MIDRILLLFLCLITSNIHYGQCSYEGGPFPITELLTSIPIQVETLGTNDLGANPLQSVCFKLQHSWSGDLVVILESPAGLRYIIAGDNNNMIGGTGSQLDVYMDVCIQANSSGPPLQGDLNNGYLFSCNGLDCIGDFSPYCGGSSSDVFLNNLLVDPTPSCNLWDFNWSGHPVNGQWTLHLACVGGFGGGSEFFLFEDWSISFLEDCVNPFCLGEENAGVLQNNELAFCYGDDNNIPNAYNTPWLNWESGVQNFAKYAIYLDENNKICSGEQSPSITDFEPGNYSMRAFAIQDSWVDFSQYIGVSEADFFADMGNNCFSIAAGKSDFSIQPYVDILEVDTLLCFGETILVNGQNVFEGTYEAIYPQADGCNTLVYLTVGLADPPEFLETSIEVCYGAPAQLFSNLPQNTDFEWSGPNGFHSTEPNPLTLPIVEMDGNHYELRITRSDGCDDYHLFTLLPTMTPTFTEASVVICEGTSYTVANSTYTESGIYQDTLSGQNGCDSIITTNLTVHPAFVDTLNVTICEGEFFEISIYAFNEPGEHEALLYDVYGCDSIYHIFLDFYPNDFNEINPTICAGESFTVGNSIYTETGVYTDVLVNYNGCDSMVITHLTVQSTFEETLQVGICEGDFFQIGNYIFDQPGIHEAVFSDVHGCDSIYQIVLELYPNDIIAINLEICEGAGFAVGNSVYFETGIYTDTLTEQNNCDSIIITNLTVHSTFSETIHSSICQGDFIDFYGIICTQPGEYEVILSDVHGCDSIYQLVLDVYENDVLEIDAAICNGESYTLANSTYFETGNYTENLVNVHGCDSTIHLNLTVFEATTLTNSMIDPSVNGSPTGGIQPAFSSDALPLSYLWSTGDTTQQLVDLIDGLYQLTVTDGHGCVEIFEFEVPIASTNEEAFAPEQIQLFPNPATAVLYLKNAKLDKATYRIIALSGKVVKTGLFQKEGVWIEELPSGLYFLEMEKAGKVYFGRFMKE